MEEKEKPKEGLQSRVGRSSGRGGGGDKPKHLNNTHPSNAVQGKSIVPTFTRREQEYF